MFPTYRAALTIVADLGAVDVEKAGHRGRASLTVLVMLFPRRFGITSLLTVAALCLCGCSKAPSVAGPVPPTPGRSPLFASDADALVAATDAYTRFLAVFDQVLAEGGAGPERLSSVVTGRALERAQSDAEEFRAKGMRTTGRTALGSPILQAYTDQPTAVAFYVCEDLSGMDLLDSSGASLVQPGHQPLTAFEAHFVAQDDGTLVLAEREFWDGPGIC